MDNPAPEGFPVASCGRCAREVLVHVEIDETGRERRRCLHCDAELDPAALRWVPERDLEALGYGVYGAGCGRPGCGGGGGCGRAP
jgi:hypothetical protein